MQTYISPVYKTKKEEKERKKEIFVFVENTSHTKKREE